MKNSYSTKYEIIVNELNEFKLLNAQSEFEKHFGNIFPTITRNSNTITFTTDNQVAIYSLNKKDLSKQLINKLDNLTKEFEASTSLSKQHFYILLKHFDPKWFHPTNIIAISENQFRIRAWGIPPEHIINAHKPTIDKNNIKPIPVIKTNYSPMDKFKKQLQVRKSIKWFLILISIIILGLYLLGVSTSNEPNNRIVNKSISKQSKCESEGKFWAKDNCFKSNQEFYSSVIAPDECFYWDYQFGGCSEPTTFDYKNDGNTYHPEFIFCILDDNNWGNNDSEDYDVFKQGWYQLNNDTLVFNWDEGITTYIGIIKKNGFIVGTMDYGEDENCFKFTPCDECEPRQ